MHPQYTSNNLDFDVAVIRVSQSFIGQNIAGISLAPEVSTVVVGSSSVVSGWGLTVSLE